MARLVAIVASSGLLSFACRLALLFSLAFAFAFSFAPAPDSPSSGHLGLLVLLPVLEFDVRLLGGLGLELLVVRILATRRAAPLAKRWLHGLVEEATASTEVADSALERRARHFARSLQQRQGIVRVHASDVSPWTIG